MNGESTERSNDHQASIDIENLASSLRREMGAMHTLSNQCCIYRVRERLRQLDEKAYTPRIVSIGPLHHGKEQFKAMEEYKRKSLQDFLRRTKVSLEDFIKVVKEKEARLRNCYAETIRFSSNEFVKMILVDAAFIIEVLLGFFYLNESATVSSDRLYNKPWLIGDVKVDIWLLENQIPFFILEDLFVLANIHICSEKDEKLSLLKLVHDFSNYFWDFFMIADNLDENKYSKVEHLVDFLRTCILPSALEQKKRPKTLTTPGVTKLHQAGVKLKVGISGKSLFDIRFRNGILEIPHIKLRRAMEVLLRNVFAFEQCHCFEDFINDYVVFISYLVDTPKDVELLVQEGIIEHRFKDDEEVSLLFHNFTRAGNLDRDDFYFSSLVEDLNRYCRTPWHKWKSTLKKKYFNTPWTTLSVVAAIVLLVLTFIQAVCSVLQVK